MALLRSLHGSLLRNSFSLSFLPTCLQPYCGQALGYSSEPDQVPALCTGLEDPQWDRQCPIMVGSDLRRGRVPQSSWEGATHSSKAGHLGGLLAGGDFWQPARNGQSTALGPRLKGTQPYPKGHQLRGGEGMVAQPAVEMLSSPTPQKWSTCLQMRTQDQLHNLIAIIKNLKTVTAML